MSIYYERNLMAGLGPTEKMRQLFQKYGKISPATQDMLDLWTEEELEPKEGLMKIKPFDTSGIDELYIVTKKGNPEKVKEIELVFPKQCLFFNQCKEIFGQHQIQFIESQMLSKVHFTNVRSMYIERVYFRVPGNLTQQEDGSFILVEPDLGKFELRPTDLKFQTFSMYFKDFGL